LTNVVVTGNAAANGGGLNNAGTATLTLIDCTVSNNTATGSGGGMQNFSGSFLNIIGSTFSGNTSQSTLTGGGAIQANGTLNIANSTFSGNTAQGGDGGAFYYNGQGLTMNNATITNNTATTGAGGFHKSTTLLNANIRNTIIAGNTGDAATPDVAGAISSQGNNLIGVVGTSTGWVASDLLNTPAQLGQLATTAV
jgi:predicted outer membrane repeat protein